MKPKATITIFACLLVAALAAAQSPITVIQNTRTAMNGVRDSSTAASNAALTTQTSATPAAASGTGAVSNATAKPGKTGASKLKIKAGTSKNVKAAAAEKKVAHTAIVGTTPAAAAAGDTASASQGDEAAEADSKWKSNGKRDPFISPVVSHQGNQACSTGKKCLEIGAIALRGIVHSESGFIAVVSNSLNKAYFLRENDPVFNGYVVKITGDSITFQETLQDRLGKTFTREVVKKITTPAV